MVKMLGKWPIHNRWEGRMKRIMALLLSEWGLSHDIEMQTLVSAISVR